MSQLTDEGYLVIAYGADRYFQAARHLALSIRICDPTRPICLLHDGNASPAVLQAFHYQRQITFRLGGYLNKLYAYDCTPFTRTMYIDTDCLMIKRDIGDWWRQLHNQCVAVEGIKRRSGSWGQWPDIAAVCRRFNVPHVVTMNAGVIYMRKSATARKIFDYALTAPREEASWYVKAVDGYNDEPLLALAMAAHRQEPIPPCFVATTWRTLQTSTLRSSDWTADIRTGVCIFKKGDTWVSPTILHLCGMSRYPELVALHARLLADIEEYSKNAYPELVALHASLLADTGCPECHGAGRILGTPYDPPEPCPRCTT